MSDLIRREDVNKAIRSICNLCGEDKKNNGVMCGACNLDSFISEYDDIPSAEPERKKGEWQRRKGSDCWECSQCHAVLENDDLGMHNFYFCYHCGANMMNKSGYMDIEEVNDEDGKRIDQ